MFYDFYAKMCEGVGKKPSRVALDLGINKSTVTQWKKNGTTPQREILQKIADYFNVTVDYLLTEGEEPANTAADESKVTFDDFTYAMYNHSSELTSDEKTMLLEMAEFMKKKRGL